MKITGVEAIELRLPEAEVLDKASGTQNQLILRIHTDEGVTGIGEIDSSPRIARAAIDAPFSHSFATGLAQVLMGENPLDIRILNQKMYRATNYIGRRGVVVHAIGGVDIALWDIAGKYFGQPIYQLLGGAYRKKLRAYASILFGKDGDETADIGRRWVEQGFTAVKFGWGPMGQNEQLDIELVAGARKGVGDKADVLVDAGCCWDSATAIRRSHQFAEYGIFWLEEPLEEDDLAGYARLTSRSRVPIAAGEGDSGRFALREFIDASGIDIVQIDLARNGFTEAVRVADYAEDQGLRVVNHYYSTGVNLAAGLHWLCTRKSAFIVEYCVEETPIRWDVTRQKMRIDSEGHVHVPEGPGLGVELDEDTIDNLRVS